MFCYHLRSDVLIPVMQKAENKHQDRSLTPSTVFPKVFATGYCQRWHTEPGGLVSIAALFQEINVTSFVYKPGNLEYSLGPRELHEDSCYVLTESDG